MSVSLPDGPLTSIADERTISGPGGRRVALFVAAILVAVIGVLPTSGVHLGDVPGFAPAMLALVACLNMLSAVMLVRQFRDAGERRALLLASAYLFSLPVLLGFAAAFPQVLGSVGPLGESPSTAPWLWVAWHTGFPVLLAASVAPWPLRWLATVPPRRRRSLARATVAAATGVGAAVVGLVAAADGWLPVIITGTDDQAMTRLVGPVIVPVVLVASIVAVRGGRRLGGPARWASVAAVATLGEVLLTLVASHRYSVGWYVGRSMSVVASAVVLVALLAEFSRLKSQLAVEAARLSQLLMRTQELEQVHATLLAAMPDGVMLHDRHGVVVAANASAPSLIGVSNDQLRGARPLAGGWAVLRADGSSIPVGDAPSLVSLMTSAAQPAGIVGVLGPDGGQRWLRVATKATGVLDSEGSEYVVSSMADETDRHNALRRARREHENTLRRVQTVLDAGGPSIVVQPIVDLMTGDVVGREVLSRFAGQPEQGPDRWFADAAQVGLGIDLELAAVRRGLAALPITPEATYLAINVSPATAASGALADLLAAPDVAADRVVLELTEHVEFTDYALLTGALADLRSLGVRVAVDDTGSGYSGLSHILNLRPEIVKLDIELVRGIHDDPARRALAAGLLIFTRQIGALLVAEGIENERELAALREVGVTHGQGYYLGRPAALAPTTDLRGPRLPRAALPGPTPRQL